MKSQPNPEFTAAWALDRRIAKGVRVEVRWTSGGRYFRGAATVVRVNKRSVRVALDEAVKAYPAGHEIVVPRILNATLWSYNNGVFEVESPVHTQPIKRGVIEEIRANGEQRVVAEDGETYFLTPRCNAASGGRVGDHVELEYFSTASRGLWYGRVVPKSPFSRRCQCGTEYVPKTIADGYCPSCMEAQRKADESANR